jgi:hypothetical protein
MNQKTVAIIGAILMLITGFLLGMSYEKQQPANVEIVAYAGDQIVSDNIESMNIDKAWFGLSTRSRYVIENNITCYDIRVVSR